MGRLLGIDHGEKRVGLALSDPLHMIASPYKTIKRVNSHNLLLELGRIILENDVDTVVVGLPLGMNGSDTRRTKQVRDFARQLEGAGYGVVLEDERLSSISAKKALIQQNIKTGHSKEHVDRVSAAIILQQYLDKHRI